MCWQEFGRYEHHRFVALILVKNQPILIAAFFVYFAFLGFKIDALIVFFLRLHTLAPRSCAFFTYGIHGISAEW